MRFRSRRRAAKRFWAHHARTEARIRHSAAELPLFGRTGWSGRRMTGYWAFAEDGTLVTAGLAHGDPGSPASAELFVFTTRREPAQLVNDLRLGHSLPFGRFESTTAAGTIKAAQRLNLPGSEATGEITIVVDTTPRVFRLWDDEEWWQAAHQLTRAHAIVLDGRLLAPADVVLGTVHDIEPYLDGHRAWIRARHRA
ncbi:hypothetical protein ABZ639_04125 [Saccharomonospora sp. NPDC006951]